MRETGYPNGRPGYHIDHRQPLACGGEDAPSNLQWLTVAEHVAKTKIDRRCQQQYHGNPILDFSLAAGLVIATLGLIESFRRE
jgi:hypothetical protein